MCNLRKHVAPPAKGQKAAAAVRCAMAFGSEIIHCPDVVEEKKKKKRKRLIEAYEKYRAWSLNDLTSYDGTPSRVRGEGGRSVFITSSSDVKSHRRTRRYGSSRRSGFGGIDALHPYIGRSVCHPPAAGFHDCLRLLTRGRVKFERLTVFPNYKKKRLAKTFVLKISHRCSLERDILYYYVFYSSRNRNFSTKLKCFALF